VFQNWTASMISPDPPSGVWPNPGQKAQMRLAADNASRFDSDPASVADGCHRGDVDLRHRTPWTAGRIFYLAKTAPTPKGQNAELPDWFRPVSK
jgi:hypothetical protein